MSARPADPTEEQPLAGVRVLDFSTLLPGPLATLLLAEAGADVLQVERPPHGDEMRSYRPRLGDTSANYTLLNRGKRSVALDLKSPEAHARLLALVADVDVVVEQFRPGVMARLGLGWADLEPVNPGLVYCSITGYGQQGPAAGRAGHDLTYLAESGLLGNVVDDRGDPHLPPSVIADIAGGTYPAVLNILLALRRRDRTGRGAHLDIGMTRHLATLAYGYLATRAGSGAWPEPGRDLLTGGSPRYRIYRTADGRHLAAAPLEERFWRRFCELVGLPEDLRDDTGREQDVIGAVAGLVAARPAAYWRERFGDEDVCCSVVASFDEAVASGALARDTRYAVATSEGAVPALPVPVVDAFRAGAGSRPAPGLTSDPDALGFAPRPGAGS